MSSVRNIPGFLNQMFLIFLQKQQGQTTNNIFNHKQIIINEGMTAYIAYLVDPT